MADTDVPPTTRPKSRASCTARSPSLSSLKYMPVGAGVRAVGHSAPPIRRLPLNVEALSAVKGEEGAALLMWCSRKAQGLADTVGKIAVRCEIAAVEDLVQRQVKRRAYDRSFSSTESERHVPLRIPSRASPCSLP